MEANDQPNKIGCGKRKSFYVFRRKRGKEKKKLSHDQPKEVQPPVSQRAQKWAEDNEWFGTDRVLTGATMSIHEDLVQQGIDAESDEYYNQINKRMKEYFPQKFAESSTEEKTKAAPVQNVAL